MISVLNIIGYKLNYLIVHTIINKHKVTKKKTLTAKSLKGSYLLY